MRKCPRCHVDQADDEKCEYCDLVFDDYVEDISTEQNMQPIVIFLSIILLIGAIFVLNKIGTSSPAKKQTVSQKTIAEDTQPSKGKSSASKKNETELETEKIKNATKEMLIPKELMDKVIPTGESEEAGNGAVGAMFFFSAFGMGYLSYGKKSRKSSFMLCGVMLMVYSYFIHNTLHIVLLGIILLALPFGNNIIQKISK